MSKPITVDALDSHKFTMNVHVRFRNLWRVRLGLWLIKLAGLLTRADVVIDAELGDQWQNADGNGVSGPWVRPGYSEVVTVSPSVKLVSTEMT